VAYPIGYSASHPWPRTGRGWRLDLYENASKRPRRGPASCTRRLPSCWPAVCSTRRAESPKSIGLMP